MQIASKFTIAVHIITATAYFRDTEKVTSNFLAGSIGVNPVIVREVIGDLKEYGIVSISQGKSGISLAKALLQRIGITVSSLACVYHQNLFHVRLSF